MAEKTASWAVEVQQLIISQSTARSVMNSNTHQIFQFIINLLNIIDITYMFSSQLTILLLCTARTYSSQFGYNPFLSILFLATKKTNSLKMKSSLTRHTETFLYVSFFQDGEDKTIKKKKKTVKVCNKILWSIWDHNHQISSLFCLEIQLPNTEEGSVIFVTLFNRNRLNL